MIQVHGKTILSMKFKFMIKAHDLNPWQFIYPKPTSHWQYQSPIFIGNIKTQFSLVISKAQHALALFKAQFSLATSKPNSHWQHQKPNLRWHYLKPNSGNIKTQFSLALLKTQANYLALFYQKPKVVNTWQNTKS